MFSGRNFGLKLLTCLLLTTLLGGLVLLVSPLEVSAASDSGVKLTEEKDGRLVFEIDSSNFKVRNYKDGGQTYQIVELEEGGLDEQEPGRPALPFLSFYIQVPSGSSCQGQVAPASFKEQSSFLLYPAQPPQPELEGATPVGFVKDKVYYSQDAWTPVQRLVIGPEENLGGVALRQIQVYPFQYNPAKQTLRHYPSLSLEVTCSGGTRGSEVLSNPFFKNIQKRLVKNQLTLPASGSMTTLRSLPSGADWLVITPSELAAAAESLASWRRQKGFYTRVATTAETGATADSIRSFILEAYQTWVPKPSFVLLLGDAEFIPPHYVTMHPYDGVYVGTDLYYATVEGSDYLPDLAIGRISVDNLDEAQDRVTKIINYERYPTAESHFYTQAAVAAYFQDGNFDNYDDRPFVKTSEEIRDFWLSQGYGVDRVYYASPNANPTNYNLGPYGNGEPLPAELLRINGFTWSGSRTDLTNLINGGLLWLNHRDHGSISGWGQPNYLVGDVASLANGSRLPVVASFNCRTGWFDNETDDVTGTGSDLISFAEAWQRNFNGGGLGVVAATRTTYTGHNDYLNKGLVDAIWPSFLAYSGGSEESLPWLGAALTYAKAFYAHFYPDYLIRKIQTEELTLFGDPASEIWTGLPRPLTVSYPDHLSVTSPSLTVLVTEPGALAVVTHEQTILGQALAEDGQAVVFFDAPLPPGQITLTVSRRGHRPYEAILTVNGPDAVTLAGGWAYRYQNGEVWLFWETASEVNHLGFTIYHSKDDSFFEARQVSTELIPAASPGSMAGSKYSLLDPQAPSEGYYWVEALDTLGQKEIFGPLALAAAPSAPANLKFTRKTTAKLLVKWAGSALVGYELELSSCSKDWSVTSTEPVTVVGNKYLRQPGLPKGRYLIRVRELYGEWSPAKRFRVTK